MKSRERRRLSLQARLDAGKTSAERNRLGQFATPGQLAEQIVAAGLALLKPREPVRFLDPGFGTGSFFSALLNQVSIGRFKHAAGFEIDDHYGAEAKILWQDSLLNLHLKDYTRAKPPTVDDEKFNLIICNPPYVRHHHLDRTQKEYLAIKVQSRCGLLLNGLSGLYCYFLLLSQAWMAERGIGVWLIPSEFMDVNYGAQVKRFLLEQVTLLRIHRFDSADVQFADALVSSAVVFVRNEIPPSKHEVQFTSGGSLEKPAKTMLIPVDSLQHAAKWTTLPGQKQANIKQPARTLADLFDIKRGLATGCNSFFVLSPEQARELHIPQQFLRPILPSPRYLPEDEIVADDAGNPILDHRRFLLDCRLSEAEVRDKFSDLWKYLQSGKRQGLDRRYLCAHRDPWYAQERRAAPLFLCTYMGRTSRKNQAPFRFILNHSRAVAANVYLLLYPKPDWFVELLAAPDLRRAVWQRLKEITGESLANEGRLYGGGLHKLEPRELAHVSAELLFELLPKISRTPSA